jgi:phage gp29-like protein
MAAAKSTLLNHLGEPIDLGRLKEEHSGPSVSGVRSVVSAHPAQGLTPERLRDILRQSENASPMPYLELAEEMEEKDLHYLGVLGTRKRAVAQLEITVKAGSDDKAEQKAADMVREWLERDELETDLIDVLDAIGKGFSRTEILWDMTATAWTPVRLEWRDPRWFTFDPVDGRTPLLVDGGASGNVYGDPLPPFKYICHDHKAKSGLPIRGGLARAAAWGYLFKNYALKDWVAFAEIFGLPMRIGKYGPGETEENIRRLMQAVTDIGSDAAAVIPQSMMIEFVSGGGAAGSVDLYERLCDYLDKQVSKATLGQTATTDAAPGAGLSGAGAQHGDVRDDIKRSDAKQLAATLNRDLITPYVRLNLGQEVKPPKLVIGQAEAWDPTVMMPAVKTFVAMGGRVGASAIRDKLGLEDPAADEALLTPESAAPAPVEIDPASGAPTGPDTAGGVSDAAPAARRASRTLLEPLKRPSEGEAAAAAATAPMPAPDAPADAVDRFVAEELDGWEELLAGTVDPLRALLAEASDLEDARDRLVGLLDGMDDAALAELLGRAGFNARLAGEVGQAIDRGEGA